VYPPQYVPARVSPKNLKHHSIRHPNGPQGKKFLGYQRICSHVSRLNRLFDPAPPPPPMGKVFKGTRLAPREITVGSRWPKTSTMVFPANGMKHRTERLYPAGPKIGPPTATVILAGTWQKPVRCPRPFTFGNVVAPGRATRFFLSGGRPRHSPPTINDASTPAFYGSAATTCLENKRGHAALQLPSTMSSSAGGAPNGLAAPLLRNRRNTTPDNHCCRLVIVPARPVRPHPHPFSPALLLQPLALDYGGTTSPGVSNYQRTTLSQEHSRGSPILEPRPARRHPPAPTGKD